MKILAFMVVVAVFGSEPILAQGGGSNASPREMAAANVDASNLKDVAARTASALRPMALLKTPTYADIYCAGYISPARGPKTPEQGAAPDPAQSGSGNFAAGGVNTPSAAKFVDGDLLYLTGNGYQVGQRVSLVRQLSHFAQYALFQGQLELIRAMGQPYADLGQATVLDTRSKTAIAHLDYSCEPVAPGDLAIPFEPRPVMGERDPFPFDRFAPEGNGLKGRIVLARDSMELLGTGAAVYLNVGAAQGVKPGDYFRISRTYGVEHLDAAESLSYMAANGEDNQNNPPKIQPGDKNAENCAPKIRKEKRSKHPVIDVSDLPRRGLGELVIVKVTATSATGVIGFALEDVHVGDDVERE